MLSHLIHGVAGGALVFAGLAYAAVPGLYRVATPGLFGLAQPAEMLYTDAPDRAAEIRAMIAEAEARTEAFFGELKARPVWVVCTTDTCKQDFGMTSNGVAIGYHYILIGPGGLNLRTMTHERVHIALHSDLGPSDILSPRYPAWFDEGLATHIAGDDRIARPRNPRDADWITLARRASDWARMRGDASSADRYGAAARLVQEIEERAGREGLRALIRRVADGADFDTEYHRLLARP